MAVRVCIQCAGAFEGKSGVRLCSPTCRQAHRPQTFKDCRQCGTRFGPVTHLARQFCSYRCKCAAQATGCKADYKTHRKARSAQSLVRYHVLAGNMAKPAACENCAAVGYVEAAHFNYDQPFRVRWLCRSCHRIWDHHEPKGGTYRVWPELQTGQPPPESEGARTR